VTCTFPPAPLPPLPRHHPNIELLCHFECIVGCLVVSLQSRNLACVLHLCHSDTPRQALEQLHIFHESHRPVPNISTPPWLQQPSLRSCRR
jgi:hypothetical protein